MSYTGNIGQPGCNWLYGGWTNSTGNYGSFGQADNPNPSTGYTITKAEEVPTSETTKTTGVWVEDPGGAAWNQTLAPNLPTGEFAGRFVYEYAGAGTGTDTCWFSGSLYAPLTDVTTPGFGWNVFSDNTWGSDFVGFNLSAVRYYRQIKKVPCKARFYQQMVIDVGAFDYRNPPGYERYIDNQGLYVWAYKYGSSNVLGSNITATAVTSTRAGRTTTNKTWK